MMAKAMQVQGRQAVVSLKEGRFDDGVVEPSKGENTSFKASSCSLVLEPDVVRTLEGWKSVKFVSIDGRRYDQGNFLQCRENVGCLCKIVGICVPPHHYLPRRSPVCFVCDKFSVKANVIDECSDVVLDKHLGMHVHLARWDGAAASFDYNPLSGYYCDLNGAVVVVKRFRIL